MKNLVFYNSFAKKSKKFFHSTVPIYQNQIRFTRQVAGSYFSSREWSEWSWVVSSVIWENVHSLMTYNFEWRALTTVRLISILITYTRDTTIFVSPNRTWIYTKWNLYAFESLYKIFDYFELEVLDGVDRDYQVTLLLV